MWTRVQLKNRAKGVLRTFYWKAFLISFIFAIVNTGSLCIFDYDAVNLLYKYLNPYIADVVSVMFRFFGYLVSLALFIFISNPLGVGVNRYFVRVTESEFDLNHIGYPLKKGRYTNVVKTMLFRYIFILLWSLLFIVPGIVKSYAYSMVPYILADNPNIGYKRALKLSEQMTHGEKFDIFVLGLSFTGWYILGYLAFLIGIYFVYPYVHLTFAELYLVLRQRSLDKGLCTYEELRLTESIIYNKY